MNPQRRLVLGSAALLAAGCKPASAYDISTVKAPFVMPSRYRETFADEFDDPDLSRFSEEGRTPTENAPAWRSRYRHSRKDFINEEKQIYVDPAYAGTGEKALGINPFSINSSILTITAQQTPATARKSLYDQAYTSGCITTERSFAQQYGYFEIRARLPLGKGLWPAFWLMPQRDAWPPEIDIFEGSGSRPGKVNFAVRDPGDKKGAGSDWLDVSRGLDGWQTFACEWTAERISFMVNGTRHWQVSGHGVHEPMYLLANLALGSHESGWIPDPDASTPLPARLEIDYIRAFGRG